MGLTVFQVLDKAIEAGGTNLAGKDIAGTAKAAASLLDEMSSSGLLDKSAGRSPKYTVTPKGREAWEREAPEDRRRQVERQEKERRRQAMADFLAAVEKKQGKALTRTELPRFPVSVRQEACDRKLVEPGAKENSYRLLPAGEEMLLAGRPVEEQLQTLRHLHQKLAAQWRAAQQRLGHDLQEAGSQALQSAGDQLAERGTAACRAFDAALAELGGLGVVAEAARQLRAEVESASQQAQQAVEAEKARLADLESRLKQEATQQRDELGSFERRVEERLAEVARSLEAAKQGGPEPLPAQRNGPPSDAAAWEAARAAHERLRQESLRIGGIVKVPDLSDAVTRAIPELTPAAFHDLLRKWQQDDKLTLQLCNDPRLEPRAAEGIQSPRGLLFYVQMR
jgi:DNA-binding MarR family transcriptional regulator